MSNTWPPSAFARLVQLLQQGEVDLAFAGLLSDEIPKVADFRLTDAVDPAKPLLNPIGVPWQIIIHHEMRALEIDPLARCIGRQQNLHLGIVPERLLGFHAVFPAHAAVDANHGL